MVLVTNNEEHLHSIPIETLNCSRTRKNENGYAGCIGLPGLPENRSAHG